MLVYIAFSHEYLCESLCTVINLVANIPRYYIHSNNCRQYHNYNIIIKFLLSSQVTLSATCTNKSNL